MRLCQVLPSSLVAAGHSHVLPPHLAVVGHLLAPPPRVVCRCCRPIISAGSHRLCPWPPCTTVALRRTVANPTRQRRNSQAHRSFNILFPQCQHFLPLVSKFCHTCFNFSKGKCSTCVSVGYGQLKYWTIVTKMLSMHENVEKVFSQLNGFGL